MSLTRILAALVIASGIVGCDDDPNEPKGDPTIAIVSGSAQTGGIVGQALGQQLVAKVTNANGTPAVGVTVNWTVAAGGGSVSPASSVTDASGHARTTLTLGPGAGNHTVKAALATKPAIAVNFTTVAVLNITVEGGAGQAATVGQALPTAFTARVSNDLNQPVPGVTVNWAVTAGGGSVAPAQSVTNASGLATTTLTVGPTEGNNQVTATIAGTPAASTVFSAAGQWETFVSTMNSAGEPTNTNVPAVGTATYKLVNGTSISYTVTVPSGLTGTWTGLHIHGPLVPPATTVGVVVNLCPTTVTCTINASGGFDVSGSFTGANVPASWGATEQARLDSLVKIMRRSDGTAYTNLHTSVNPTGQIRGPIVVRPPAPAPARRED